LKTSYIYKRFGPQLVPQSALNAIAIFKLRHCSLHSKILSQRKFTVRFYLKKTDIDLSGILLSKDLDKKKKKLKKMHSLG